MKTKPIKKIIVIMESPNGRHYGFRYIRCEDGARCEAQISGNQSNILSALTHDGSNWCGDYFYTIKRTPEREIFSLPNAGCKPDDIRKWVELNLSTEVKP